MFKTIERDVCAEIVEKKSKFIANIFYIESIEQAEMKIKEIKKKYFDARHNCFAYSVYTKEGFVNKMSDDGEPSGTAGAPMLNIITSQNLTNVLIVVTRYFGGILLGTGGLVRAYTGATQEALNTAVIISKEIGLEVKYEINYSDIEKAKYYMKQNNINIIETIYTQNIELIVEITKEKFKKIDSIKKDLNFDILEQTILKEKNITV